MIEVVPVNSGVAYDHVQGSLYLSILAVTAIGYILSWQWMFRYTPIAERRKRSSL
jgi:hypothetical protein